MKDRTGREFNDELSDFLVWYLDTRPGLWIPEVRTPVHFVEKVVGITIYSRDQFQVQLFSCEPNGVIPKHKHPNVDSFEVALWGMELSADVCGKYRRILSIKQAPKRPYLTIRILPSCLHGAKAGPQGGCFLSVQHWLNGVKPSSVGNDWDGNETMGADHSKQVDK